MNPERIVNHLKYVLGQEVIPFEESALWQLGRAADGSMRDALSLTDQAISYGSGKISEVDVAAMLGTLDQAAVYEIVTALASLDGKSVLNAVHKMSEQAPDYSNALAEMLSMLHRIAIAQALPEAVDNSHGDREQIMQLAQQMPSEDIQLFYQTALLGRRDLPLAPDPRAGFEMVLLRMLAFKPQGVLDVPTQALPPSSARLLTSAPVPPPLIPTAVSLAVPAVMAVAPAEVSIDLAVAPESLPFDAPYDNSPSAAAYDNDCSAAYDNAQENGGDDYDEYAPAPAYLEVAARPDAEEQSPLKKYEAAQPLSRAVSEMPAPAMIAEVMVMTPAPQLEPQQKISYEQASPKDWPAIYVGLGVSGILQSTIANCQWLERHGNEFHFILDENNCTLYDPSHQQRLADLLSDYFVERIQVQIQFGKVTVETPAMIAIRHKQERQANAIVAIKTDPIVLQLMAQLDATLREDTIEPV